MFLTSKPQVSCLLVKRVSFKWGPSHSSEELMPQMVVCAMCAPKAETSLADVFALCFTSPSAKSAERLVWLYGQRLGDVRSLAELAKCNVLMEVSQDHVQ
eukprot:s162_g11.t1